ncbi:hypothetical protein [Pedobacter sp. N23S346]|uniref:hypothetical protein n=1 Tax=Pedobacter sp. N23S346 TaxID=3402750 RepID=UPI003AD5F71B
MINNQLSRTFTRLKADSIRNYLAQISNEKIQDTIIVKYEFNKETCWNVLDEQSDQYIARVIQSANDYTERYQNIHTNVTILRIRESGNNFNKLVFRNPKVIVDGGYLRQNVFVKRATCGTSMKLYPDGRYEFILSDSHFKILELK